MKGLTDKQIAISEFLVQWSNEYGYAPSLQDIAQNFSIGRAAAAQHLKALEAKGIISKQREQHRSIKVNTEMLQPHLPLDHSLKHEFNKNDFSDNASWRLPFYESIPAGAPQTIDEDSKEFLELNPEFFSRGELAAIRIKGDSMNGDQINSGDIAVIKVQKTASQDDIVAVQIGLKMGDYEITLKRVKREGNQLLLIPSNPAYEIKRVDADDAMIIGKLVSLIRKY